MNVCLDNGLASDLFERETYVIELHGRINARQHFNRSNSITEEQKQSMLVD